MTENAKWVPPMPVDYPEGTMPEWNGSEWVLVELPKLPDPIPMPPLDACKLQAKVLLSQSDWAVLPDVNIANRAEFEAYRAALRNLVINPVADPIWPIEPQQIWA